MVHTGTTVRMLQTVACIVGMALVLWSLGIPTFIRETNAANLTSVTDTLSDSDRGVPSNHTIAFRTPSGLVSGETITITFPAGFNLAGTGGTGLDYIDIDVETASGSPITVGPTAATSTWGVATTSSSITLTTSTSSGVITVASSTGLIVRIGTNAVTGPTGDTRITNPSSAGSAIIAVATPNDSGDTRVAIIDDVVVTADVATTFTFTITGVATSSTVNGSPTTTAGSSTATSIPFGTLVSGTTTMMAQDLSVLTNATNGFVVTVEQSQNLLSSTGADIDGFANGAYTNTPAAWSKPTGQLANEATWGHWGITSEDDLNTNEFGTDLWVAASTTPRQVFHNGGPADGVTANSGSTRVGYQVEISALQEAGDDYTTTLTYIATPTF